MDQFLDYSKAEAALWLTRAVRIGIILLIAYLLSVGVNRFVRRLKRKLLEVMEKHEGRPDPELEKRTVTLGSIIARLLSVLIWVVALLTILSELRVDIKPILAGAGIAGIAIGFGAQNLIRDLLSGFFILSENQMRVNDIVRIGEFSGLVEEINLRTTVLRSLDGTVHIIPNGAIQSISNLTREFSYYVFDIGVAYKEDTDRVVEVLRETAAELQADPAFSESILEPIEVLGVDRFADSAVIIRARFKTQPQQQFRVGREMNRRIKKKFDQTGIEIPFPHRSLYFGEASKPVQIAAMDRPLLKELIREALNERDAVPPGP